MSASSCRYPEGTIRLDGIEGDVLRGAVRGGLTAMAGTAELAGADPPSELRQVLLALPGVSVFLALDLTRLRRALIALAEQAALRSRIDENAQGVLPVTDRHLGQLSAAVHCGA